MYCIYSHQLLQKVWWRHICQQQGRSHEWQAITRYIDLVYMLKKRAP